MTKELKITDENLQDVGLRPLVTALMMEHGFTKGFVRNNDDNSVSVFAEASQERLNELREALQHEIKRESEKPYSMISKDFKISEWADPNPHSVELMLLSGNFNDMLSLRQVTKGASVMQNGFGDMREGFKNMTKAINDLPDKIAKAIRGK